MMVKSFILLVTLLIWCAESAQTSLQDQLSKDGNLQKRGAGRGLGKDVPLSALTEVEGRAADQQIVNFPRVGRAASPSPAREQVRQAMTAFLRWGRAAVPDSDYEEVEEGMDRLPRCCTIATIGPSCSRSTGLLCGWSPVWLVSCVAGLLCGSELEEILVSCVAVN